MGMGELTGFIESTTEYLGLNNKQLSLVDLLVQFSRLTLSALRYASKCWPGKTLQMLIFSIM